MGLSTAGPRRAVVALPAAPIRCGASVGPWGSRLWDSCLARSGKVCFEVRTAGF